MFTIRVSFPTNSISTACFEIPFQSIQRRKNFQSFNQPKLKLLNLHLNNEPDNEAISKISLSCAIEITSGLWNHGLTK